MDLRRLKHVVVLAKLLSYTKAAEELCITQSALSRSIQALEKQANVKLFDRDRSGVYLTAVGRDFVKRASQLLRDADDLERSLHRSASAEIGEVAFGIGPLAAQALLTHALPQLFANKPELHSNIMVRNIDALLPALLKEEIELLVSAENERMQSLPLQSEFLGSFPLSLIVRSGHPLLRAGKKNHPVDYPLLSPGSVGSIHHWPNYWKGYLNGPHHIVDDYGVAARITELTDAIWLSSTLAAMPDIKAGRFCEIVAPGGEKPLTSKLMMYSLNRRTLSPGALLLKEMFQAYLGDVGAGV